MVQLDGPTAGETRPRGVGRRLRELLTRSGYQPVTPVARNSTRTAEHLDALYREFLATHEPMPDLPSSVRGFFADSANQEVRVVAAFAPRSIPVPLYRDPDGWTPIDDWASAELLLELAGADFSHVRLGNRGRGAVQHEVSLADLIRSGVGQR